MPWIMLAILARLTDDRRMARVSFTSQLRRFTETPEVETGATTLRGALDAAFAVNPRLRGYVLDDQGHLRVNVAVFVDGRRCTDRIRLLDALHAESRVHVFQALSGG
jgi:sulfur-carrier protein